MVHNGKIITETAAIVTYLAEVFPEKNFIPEKRAEFYRWMFFFSGPAEAAFMDKLAGLSPDKDMQVYLGYGNIERVIQTLESWIKERTYIAENQFSAADCYATSFLDYLREQNLYDSTIFQNYCANHLKRPAAIKAEMIDNEAMQKMGGVKP